MNRRNRTRFKTDITVNLTCHEINKSYKGKARLADLSAYGLSLILKDDLPIGTTVKVEWGQSVRDGELIYCKPHGREFLAGFKVEDPVYEITRNTQH